MTYSDFLNAIKKINESLRPVQGYFVEANENKYSSFWNAKRQQPHKGEAFGFTNEQLCVISGCGLSIEFGDNAIRVFAKKA